MLLVLFVPDEEVVFRNQAGAELVGLVTKVDERRLERWVCEPCFEDFATEFGWVLSAA